VRFLGGGTSSLGDATSSLGDAKSSLGYAKSSLGDAKSFLGDFKSSLRDAKSSLGDAKSSLGYAKSSLGDAKSSLGDAKSLLGDAKSLLGDAKSWLGDAKSWLGGVQAKGDGYDGAAVRAAAQAALSQFVRWAALSKRTTALADDLADLATATAELAGLRFWEGVVALPLAYAAAADPLNHADPAVAAAAGAAAEQPALWELRQVRETVDLRDEELEAPPHGARLSPLTCSAGMLRCCIRRSTATGGTRRRRRGRHPGAPGGRPAHTADTGAVQLRPVVAGAHVPHHVGAGARRRATGAGRLRARAVPRHRRRRRRAC
jgi:hypothetical protein